MRQGVLPFQYEQEKRSTGMTALSGLIIYLELLHASGLKSSIERHVGLREYGQGWTDSQIVNSLILLNPVSSTGQALAGGESVSDLDVLDKDAGLCKLIREIESCGMGGKGAGRWRGDGVWSVVGACRRSPQCSGTWRCSMTRARRRSGKLTEHSSLHPAKR